MKHLFSYDIKVKVLEFEIKIQLVGVMRKVKNKGIILGFLGDKVSEYLLMISGILVKNENIL
jgi:hypothetical protein